MPELLISIVSHRQGALAARLLEDLQRLPSTLGAEIVLTLNVPEPVPDFGRIRVVRNAAPRGFGANHNAAFRAFPSRKFCVLNPDLRLPADPFAALLPLVGGADALAAPAIVNERGAIEDSARRLPTPFSILRKAFFDAGLDYQYRDALLYPEWVAGMFLLFDSDAFRGAGGFDERYFLYYEDVDLCCRLRLAGRRVVVDPRVRVVHDARRTSHRDPRYLRWHLQSMLRFFTSPTYRRLRQG
jgi:hypothetical protein